MLRQELLVLGADSDTSCVTSDTADTVVLQHVLQPVTASVTAHMPNLGSETADTAADTSDTSDLSVRT